VTALTPTKRARPWQSGPRPATIAAAAALGVTVAEFVRLRQQVSCALANLGEFRLYWSPRHRRILARSVSITRPFRVPPDALQVGIYSAPVRARDVLGDLEEIIARLREPAAILTAPADPCERSTPEPETPAPAAPAGAGEAIKA
jgi:hypothetical protein